MTACHVVTALTGPVHTIRLGTQGPRGAPRPMAASATTSPRTAAAYSEPGGRPCQQGRDKDEADDRRPAVRPSLFCADWGPSSSTCGLTEAA